MRYYNKIVKVKIDREKAKKAKEFAIKVAHTTNYSDTNQTDKQLVTDNHFVSKLAEEAVGEVFKRFTTNVTEPDYTIYYGKGKSWDHDLYVNGVGLAVKSMRKSTAYRMGNYPSRLSWVFQDGGNRHDTVLKDPEAWVCFVEYDDMINSDGSRENAFYVYPPMQIKDLVFKEPIANKLKGLKKVVYATDIIL